jgi:hypothetical protein
MLQSKLATLSAQATIQDISDLLNSCRQLQQLAAPVI